MHYLNQSMFALLLLILSTLVGGEIVFKGGAPSVSFGESKLSGTVKFSRDGRPYTAFLGIQYATVAERFAPPEVINKPNWKGVKNASEPGAFCAQKSFGTTSYLGVEDCLELNVYVPMNARVEGGGDLLPVMVWIHGGGYFTGAGIESSPVYFMDEDVVIVTLNYRLGLFGFLSTGDDIVPGNNGLKDQAAALKWINQNIKTFGGDQNSVTIFGESAGGASTHFLMLSESTKGFVHRVISQSATAVLGYRKNPRENAVNLAAYLNCSTEAHDSADITSEEILNCFKSTAIDVLITAQFEFSSSWPDNLVPQYFSPVVEPTPKEGSTNVPFITKSALELVSDKSNTLKEIPWLIGMNEDDAACIFSCIILNRPDLMEEINEKWESILPQNLYYEDLFTPEEEAEVTKKIWEFYFRGEPVSLDTRDNLTNMYTDGMFTYITQRPALDTAARGKSNPVFLYQYAYHGPESLLGTYLNGTEKESNLVGHGDELQHLFDMTEIIPEMEPSVKPNTPHEVFSKNLIKLWTSFAIHGYPKYSWGKYADQKWQPISQEEINNPEMLKWYRIESNPRPIISPYRERVAFWEKLWRDHFDMAIIGNDLFLRKLMANFDFRSDSKDFKFTFKNPDL